MENILHFSNLYSHPEKLLEEHLCNVAKLIESFLSEKPEHLRNNISGTARIIGLVHDLGKANKYFQEYLLTGNDIRTELTSHSLFSAVCAYYLVKETTQDVLLPLFAYIVVKRHHGDLINVMDEISNFDENDCRIILEQLESINDEALEIISCKLCNAGLPILLNKSTIKEWFCNFYDETRRYRRFLRNLSDTRNYIILMLLYSLLLDADKSDAVIRDINFVNRKSFGDEDLLETYFKKAKFPDTPINFLRNNAYREVLSRSLEKDKRIYSINLPTGLGKTIISLAFTLKLRKKLEKEGVMPRLIYSLPYLSIIEQNAKVIEDILEKNQIDITTNILLKHHHLIDLAYSNANNDYEPDESKILIEGWNSEIVITTFVQLFHSLLSNKNKAIRKFHRLANSIVVLDEVQSIPIKYWALIRDMLCNLAEIMNLNIVLSTATKPLIFYQDETVELVKREEYFNSLDRVSIFPKLNTPITIDELAQINFDSNKTYLFIFNTISCAKKFYKMLVERGFQNIGYLSTHVLPKERLKRIEEIKKGFYKIVISTQLVEAGVDIDFNVVYRDIAPLDCINQSAGRCNRNGITKGEIYVIKLINEKQKLYSSYVYDCVLIDITEKILSTKVEIKEKEFLEIIEQYYSMVRDRINQSESSELLKAVTKLRFDKVEPNEDRLCISDFKLIENDYPKKDVFIEIDEEADWIWKEFNNLKLIEDRFDRKTAFEKLKPFFYQYVISVPMSCYTPASGDLGYISKTQVEDFYDKNTGFIIKDERTEIIF